MREILFRGKRKNNGEWVEGYFNRYSIGNRYFISQNGEYDEDRPYMDFSVEADFFEIIPETVGQYTGLTDKNGQKIYEGDIVKYGDTVHKVVFENRNKTAYFGLVYSPLETLPFGHYQDLRQIEVIGNVHDNPKLIGGEPE